MIIYQRGGNRLWKKTNKLTSYQLIENGNKKNKEKTRIDGYRRTARLFINKHSNPDDLEELKNLIKLREEELKNKVGNESI